ncbi:DEAD/DEAH box helicase [Microbulbifer thermotolerans]|uniref:DEAD/DEAH box helicase n=1 Tax=Microbulbifer thermotolerans TaxID=252514 RepID=UPI00224898C0|nr:DEAD/DEAH box helicase [Microbulbifer thermotolerans]MCX2830430.1 DEAD/DEAH box helicase [Microbulbifer thermotolerans]
MQIVTLKMLQEQGVAEEIPNGYRMDADAIVALDEEHVELLQLPGRFTGSFKTQISGHTRKSSFSVQIFALLDGDEYPVQRKGPFISLGEGRYFLLTSAELLAFRSLERHQQLPPEGRNEVENLQLMARLQTARRSGMQLDLSNFNRLDVVVPDDIGVVATQLPDGSLELCPSLGEGLTPDLLDTRWGQLDLGRRDGVLRVQNQLVLLDPEKMSAVWEVLGNRRIPADRVKDFIRAPSAFLDASLVNLDLGFSLRVLGVGRLKHMDFGLEDSERRDWFALDDYLYPPEALKKNITCEEELRDFKEKLRGAAHQCAEAIEFNGSVFDISDAERVKQVIEEIEQAIRRPDRQDTSAESNESAENREKVTVLLREAEQINQSLHEKAANITDTHTPDWEALLRSPFPHQKQGIEWMLGLAKQALQDDRNDLYRVQGALLADDMGLGKTFMTLVVLGEYMRMQKTAGKTQKPALVVAPLSLLENWEQEIAYTFKDSPFRDVKVLQSGRDLKEFRIKGVDRESAQLGADGGETIAESGIRYALHFGAEAGTKRLDMDRRLVLTTYQTLRDYQFSMCVIDWGIVVFDEAQNIKNPNTLQARAAKGLKADFKLLATGTPVENSLGDFWCLMDTAQPGLLGSWSYFRDRWISPIKQASDEDRDKVRRSVGAGLREAVGNFMLRRVKEEQLKGLPAKYIRSALTQTGVENFQPAEEMAAVMEGPQLAAYDAVLDAYRKGASSGGENRQALAALHRLRAVSLHPRLHDGASLVVKGEMQCRAVMSESARLKVVLNQLDEIRSRDEKVILFLVTKQMQRLLKLWLEQIYKLNIHIINGDSAAVKGKKDILTRKGMIEDFEAVPGFNIIIMSPVAAGVGLTVVGANHVIHVERHWNPAKEAQATDRVYRIGQTRDVFVYLPAALHPKYDSFDVHLDRLLNSKLMLKDAVVTPDIVTEADMIKSMGL